ncbi:hypothetical protein TNCV_3166051 [Trichonephila clavipes]|uniref:Uncharacterized protein n=1 Tax=Trichonephila clavipes TaxID=2585209 RepID=A0A8X6REK2_TRICX|nr:hypothetical protein TNCV_3166051 [Trichonephila clavipes]
MVEFSAKRGRFSIEKPPSCLPERHFVDYIPEKEKKSNPTRLRIICCSKRERKGKRTVPKESFSPVAEDILPVREISLKSFKDKKILIYVVKSSSRSFCRAWDRVIIGRDDSDRLVRNLRYEGIIFRIWSENPSLIILDIKPSCQILSKALAMSTNSIPMA